MSALGKKDVETPDNLKAVRRLNKNDKTVTMAMKRMFDEGRTIDQVVNLIRAGGGDINKYAMAHWRHREGYVKTQVVVKKKKKKGMCTACHRRPIKPGNHFLCRDCEREAPTGEMIYTVGTIARHDSRF